MRAVRESEQAILFADGSLQCSKSYDFLTDGRDKKISTSSEGGSNEVLDLWPVNRPREEKSECKKNRKAIVGRRVNQCDTWAITTRTKQVKHVTCNLPVSAFCACKLIFKARLTNSVCRRISTALRCVVHLWSVLTSLRGVRTNFSITRQRFVNKDWVEYCLVQ